MSLFGMLAVALLLLHCCRASVDSSHKQDPEYPSKWEGSDPFDDILRRFYKVSEDNCAVVHTDDLMMPEDSVSHLPDLKELNQNPVFPNRTALLHLHNAALSRAFFFSYVLQSRLRMPALNVTYDPGMMYYFLSTVADVSANPRINASAVYFSPDTAYTSSYRGFFNMTMPLFGPRTYKKDFLSFDLFDTKDLGAIPTGSEDVNYRKEWYFIWLPDNVSMSTLYDVAIRYSDNTNATFSFHGPRAADEHSDPIKWIRPCFDSGGSNKWKFAAAVPIVDIFPRHTRSERPVNTATAVLELALEKTDFDREPSPRSDISWNATKHFESEALVAVRTANFISAFLQVNDNQRYSVTNPKEVFIRGIRVVDRSLTEDQMIGEALAMVMGNSRVLSAGIFWDDHQFYNRTSFAPYAYKSQLNTRKFHVDDLARHNKYKNNNFNNNNNYNNNNDSGSKNNNNSNDNDSGNHSSNNHNNTNNNKELYTRQEWFKALKSCWGNCNGNLEKHLLHMWFRSLARGDDVQLKHFESLYEHYRAANLNQGYWTAPYIDSDGPVKTWKITYASPFFGWGSPRSRLKFKGVVAVSMDISRLCEEVSSDGSAKNSTLEDCVAILSRGFEPGEYKCGCRHFEYDFDEDISFIHDPFHTEDKDTSFIDLVKDRDNKNPYARMLIALAALLLVLIVDPAVRRRWRRLIGLGTTTSTNCDTSKL